MLHTILVVGVAPAGVVVVMPTRTAKVRSTKARRNASSTPLLDDTNDTTAAEVNCRQSERIGWRHGEGIQSILRGAATLAAASHGCPTSLLDTFSGSFGWTGPSTVAMQCSADGGHPMPGTTHFIRNEFNRTNAFHVERSTCATFRWARAKAAKQERQTHAGPALLGTDRDIGRILHAGRVGRFSLMNMGMNYSKRRRDGLWTPCTNVAFVMCALKGWLPGQGGVPLIHLATPGRSLMRRCRPCAECQPSLHWDECYIVRSEYCMLERYCANGHEIWDYVAPGNWTCVPRRRALSSRQGSGTRTLSRRAEPAGAHSKSKTRTKH